MATRALFITMISDVSDLAGQAGILIINSYPSNTRPAPQSCVDKTVIPDSYRVRGSAHFRQPSGSGKPDIQMKTGGEYQRTTLCPTAEFKQSDPI